MSIFRRRFLPTCLPRRDIRVVLPGVLLQRKPCPPEEILTGRNPKLRWIFISRFSSWSVSSLIGSKPLIDLQSVKFLSTPARLFVQVKNRNSSDKHNSSENIKNIILGSLVTHSIGSTILIAIKQRTRRRLELNLETCSLAPNRSWYVHLRVTVWPLYPTAELIKRSNDV